jgi:hydrogenase maturation protein HypF
LNSPRHPHEAVPNPPHGPAADSLSRLRMVVRGVVQGVGFRPFVHRLAGALDLKGWVLNSTEGVVIEVEGAAAILSTFQRDLMANKPPLAVIEHVEATPLPPVGYSTFTIESSKAAEGDAAFVLVSPDIATCPDCLRELQDPHDRRYRYPFINCTNCGPRFTIVRDVPYDRPKTTMAGFSLCPDCEREYHDPADRRFHAQPVACPACGPHVWLVDSPEASGSAGQSPLLADEAIGRARQLLAGGKIVAIKGLGGFHLACDASNHEAVARLRQRKGRVDKPFAIMCPTITEVESLCLLDEGERELLESPQRPIVLLQRRPGGLVSPHVAPGNRTLGVMLPYTPLHTLLFTPLAADTSALRALVMTSGNLSEEPIATENEEALSRLATLADAYLFHDRPIHVRCDDSVTRLFRGREMVLRRSRGYAPFPVRLGADLPSVLAVGGELKNTFCLTRENYAFLSQHIGDLENAETLSSFEQGIDHFRRLFRVTPGAVAHDLHPEYLSTKWAQWAGEQVAGNSGRHLAGLPLIPVQHHHAHLAACLAENGVQGAAIGVSWDGTGYGTDGAIWGGEFLVGDLAGFRRLAHFQYAPLPGGEAAIRRPYRTALSQLVSAFGDQAWSLDLPFMRTIDPTELAVIRRQIATGLNSPLTSSAGRLFDAVAALLGIRGVVNYEGQAAIEMESLAAREPAAPAYSVAELGLAPQVLPNAIDPAPLIRTIVSDLRAGAPPAFIAARFHATMAALIAAVCGIIAWQERLDAVCLSGGVFQNVLLLEQTVDLLAKSGLTVHTHHQVPANDGGLALGQAVVAATILQRSRSNP